MLDDVDVDVMFQGSHLFSGFSVPLKDRLNVPFLLQPFKANPSGRDFGADLRQFVAATLKIYAAICRRDIENCTGLLVSKKEVCSSGLDSTVPLEGKGDLHGFRFSDSLEITYFSLLTTLNHDSSFPSPLDHSSIVFLNYISTPIYQQTKTHGAR